MTLSEVLAELESYGDAQTKKTLMNHGAKEPFFGVKVADLKKILKKTKKNHELSLELYKTGNSDAMYLAGLMADEKKITENDLEAWANAAYWSYLCDFAVPWVASETPFGFKLGLNWIQSDKENVACAGWATLSSIASILPDEKLDITKYSELLDQVAKEIHNERNRVRMNMNRFIIAIGCFIPALTEKAKEIATKVGVVMVDMGGTACKVPSANEYIDKVIAKGSIGKKRKEARC